MAYGRRYKRKTTVRKRSSVRKGPFKRYNSRALVAKAKTRSLVKLIKGVTLKQAETCYRTLKHESFTLYHNSISALHGWYPTIPVASGMFPTQGNTDGNRRGDEIFIQGIKIRMVLNIPYDRRNTTIRMYFLQWNSSQGDPGDRTQFLHDVTGNIMIDPVQTDRWGHALKYLGTYTPRAKDLSPTGQHSTILINKWMPMRKKVTFTEDGSVIPSNLKENGYIFFLPYSTTGALQTDIVAENCQCTMTLYYKDP